MRNWRTKSVFLLDRSSRFCARGVRLMLRRTRLIACACAILDIAVCSAPALPPLRNRRAFAEAMSKVHEGMSQAEIIALVGKPDDVTTQKDWEVAFADVREIW